MDPLAKYLPFKVTGDDFASSNPIFAFYFYKYFLTMSIPIYNYCEDAAEKQKILTELEHTKEGIGAVSEAAKNGLSDEEKVKTMIDYTYLMFAKNDHYHREGQINKQIAEDFLTISRLYEVANKFSKLDYGQLKRKVYSKKKFIEIMKAIKNNPTAQTETKQQSNMNYPTLYPPPPVFVKQYEKKIEHIEYKIRQSHFNPLPKPTSVMTIDKVHMQMEASKCLENAVSEISFDRYKYARVQVVKALALLDSLIEY